jgi:hypothetical protein
MWGSMPLMTVSTTIIIVLHSVEVVHVPQESWLSLESWILIVPMSTLTYFRGVCQAITTRLFNDFIYLVTYPLRFYRQCEHRTHPEAPSCALWVPTISAVLRLSHRSAIAASLNIPAVLPSQLLCTTSWYAKTRLYHILCQVVPI